MLLLVIDTELDNRLQRGGIILSCARKQLMHGRVDVRPVLHNFSECRPRNVTALCATMPLAGVDIVGIEQETVARMERSIIGNVLLQNERLEEPAGMSQMPFRRTDIRRRLNNTILGSQTAAQLLSCTPGFQIVVRKAWQRGSDVASDHCRHV